MSTLHPDQPDASPPGDAATGPVVVAARRTPIGTAHHALAGVPVETLAAAALSAVVADLPAGAPDVAEVVLGVAAGPGGCTARVAALAAGLGHGVAGVTLDRQCGSGLEALRVAAALVAAGQAPLVLAGGAESASTSPGGGRQAPFTPHGWADPGMGEAADALAAARGVDRTRQDAYAVRSHARAVAAADAGRFDAELVPVAGLTRDERPRRTLSTALAARFPPAFTAAGTATAVSSSGISDGAAGLAVVPEALRARLGLPGLAVRATAVTGVDPAQPGLGAATAVRAVLDRGGVQLADLDLLEVTEAFAGQLLACTDELGLDVLGADADRVCPDGGAIALGHPWGASGAVLVVRAFSAMVRRRGPQLAVAACAVGGGQGVAVLLERVGDEA